MCMLYLSDQVSNFHTLSEGEIDTLGTIYQTRGIMHYPNNNAAKEAGLQTLLTWDGSPLRSTDTSGSDPENVFDMEMTPLDIYRVNKLYQCNSKLESK